MPHLLAEAMLRKMYDWVMGLAASPKAELALAGIAFAESSFFPLPPDIMLAPMVLARPDRAWRLALICTLASVAGGVLGYGIGMFAADLAQKLLALMGHPDAMQAFRCEFARWGAALILVKGLTPIPYKLVTIAAGLASFSFPLFIICSVVTRGARFFMVAFVIKKFGPTIMPVVERRMGIVAIVIIVLLVAGFAASHWLGHGSHGAC
jgi:membrane protein YqaA with SNARE-associated domain